MLYTIAVTQKPSPLDARDKGATSKLVVPPDNTIMAECEQSAVLLFAVKHAKELDGINPDLISVEFRKGV
jgi:hypothetical protein